MPSMPSHCGSAAGKAPSPISVEVIGKPVSFDQFAQQVARLRAGIDDAAAGVEQRPLGAARISSTAALIVSGSPLSFGW